MGPRIGARHTVYLRFAPGGRRKKRGGNFTRHDFNRAGNRKKRFAQQNPAKNIEKSLD